jgi:hypothetical protein
VATIEGTDLGEGAGPLSSLRVVVGGNGSSASGPSTNHDWRPGRWKTELSSSRNLLFPRRLCSSPAADVQWDPECERLIDRFRRIVSSVSLHSCYHRSGSGERECSRASECNCGRKPPEDERYRAVHDTALSRSLERVISSQVRRGSRHGG